MGTLAKAITYPSYALTALNLCNGETLLLYKRLTVT